MCREESPDHPVGQSLKQQGKIESINLSTAKGGPKHPVQEGRLLAGHGFEGDAHAGPGPKQVSMLAWESALGMRSRGADVGYGSFGENITTSGMDARRVRVGDRIALGDRAVVEVTGIGKKCHRPCGIFRRVGSCIMPEEGVFCAVIEGGLIRVGDTVTPLRAERARPGNERGIGRRRRGER
jgi:MOSC domain-containing protein YiiM